MAIQKVSDLPIFRKTDKEFDYDKVLASLIELSYKISSDEKENVSRYQSKAVTLKELADFILSAQGGTGTQFPSGMSLSGDVYVNEGVDDGVFAGYVVSVNTGTVGVDAALSWSLSSQQVAVAADAIRVRTAGNDAVTADSERIRFGTAVEFGVSPTVPAVSESSPGTAAVNKAYVDQAGTGGGHLMFETKYLDYFTPELSDSGWVCTTVGAWLAQGDFQETYSHLTADFEGGDDITIAYGGVPEVNVSARRAPDGHMVCKADQLDKVTEIYESARAAWVYVIDPDNRRFMLPRNGRFFAGMASESDVVGGYTQAELPQHQHDVSISGRTDLGLYSAAAGTSQGGGYCGAVLNSCRSHNTSPIKMLAGNVTSSGQAAATATVKPPSVSMHLYMYCR